MKRVTLEEIKQVADGKGILDRDAIRNAELLLDFYYNEENGEKLVKEVLTLYNKALVKLLRLLGRVPYYSRNALLSDLMARTFPANVSDLFPIAIYISSSPQDKDTVGILVHENGKRDLFEGNDEASNETYALVNRLLGGGKEVRIWGMHTEDLVYKIKQTKTIPEGLYVSPSRSYAEGHYDLEKKNRVLFSGTINDADVRKESDVDWKTLTATEIKKMQIY